MTSTSTLKLKCAGMTFSELLAFKNLTNSYYNRSIQEAADPADQEGLIEELNIFNSVVDNIAGERVANFLPELVQEV